MLLNDALVGKDPCWEQAPKSIEIPDRAQAPCWTYNLFGQKPLIDRNHTLAINPIWAKATCCTKPHIGQKTMIGQKPSFGQNIIWTKHRVGHKPHLDKDL